MRDIDPISRFEQSLTHDTVLHRRPYRLELAVCRLKVDAGPVENEIGWRSFLFSYRQTVTLESQAGRTRILTLRSNSHFDLAETTLLLRRYGELLRLQHRVPKRSGDVYLAKEALLEVKRQLAKKGLRRLPEE